MANDQQMKDYLIPWRDNPRGFTGIALTEPEGGGSDNILPCLDPKAGAKLAAKREGDHVILNGMKHYMTLNPYVTLWLTFARTDKNKPVSQGMTIFLVPADTPGVSVGNVHNKMGVRLCPNAEVIFENARIPITAQLGGWGTGLVELGRDVLPISNACTAAAILGAARAAMEMAIEHARERVQGAKPIIQHQAVLIRLADMWVNIETARLLIWRAMCAFDEIERSGKKTGFDPKVFKAPKLYTSEAAIRTVLEAKTILGGLGVMKDVGMEKLVRDVITYHHADGTNDVLRLGLATHLS
jgi:alkylation response protein AidB-like acyl-CoA dehydrogenase